MIVPHGDLGNEVGPDSTDGPRLFARDGYVVGRGVVPREPLDAMRHDLIERFASSGIFAPIQHEEDVVPWSGRPNADDATMSPMESMMAQKKRVDGFTDQVLELGILEPIIERLWGRPALVHHGTMLTMSIPGEDQFGTSPHRDIGPGGEDRVRFWVPLVRIELLGGGLALAAGSHLLDELPEPSGRSQYVSRSTGKPVGMVPEDFGDAWRGTAYEVGDALLFRPDIVHASTANRTNNVRLAVPFFATDARLPEPPSARLSNLELSRRSIEVGPKLAERLASLGATQQETRALMGELAEHVPSNEECRAMLAELRGETQSGVVTHRGPWATS